MDTGQDRTSDSAPETGLTGREREMLAFEHRWWKHPGAKDQAIKEAFDLSPTRYYQLLNRLADKQEAMSIDPVLVKRLHRVRTSRHQQRMARRLGWEAP